MNIPRHRGGGKYVFDPPTLTEDFRKIDRVLFWKIARRRWKNFGSLFSKIWRFLAVLTVFNGFIGCQCLLNTKKVLHSRKFWELFGFSKRPSSHMCSFFAVPHLYQKLLGHDMHAYYIFCTEQASKIVYLTQRSSWEESMTRFDRRHFWYIK